MVGLAIVKKKKMVIIDYGDRDVRGDYQWIVIKGQENNLDVIRDTHHSMAGSSGQP